MGSPWFLIWFFWFTTYHSHMVHICYRMPPPSRRGRPRQRPAAALGRPRQRSRSPHSPLNRRVSPVRRRQRQGARDQTRSPSPPHLSPERPQLQDLQAMIQAQQRSIDQLIQDRYERPEQHDMRQQSQQREIRNNEPDPRPTQQAAQPMQAIINNAALNLPGPSNPAGETLSPYLTLGTTVNPKLKSDIWAGQYIELAKLNAADSAPAVSVSWTGQKPSISMEQPQLEPPESFLEWLKLFNTYAAIYLEVHPLEAGPMLTYVVRIMELLNAHEGTVWRSYDERFRRLKEHCPTMAWSQTNWQLVMEVTSGAAAKSPSVTKSSNKKQPFRGQSTDNRRPPNGSCYKFYYQGACSKSDCKYTHMCAVCKKTGHSKLECKNKQNNNKGGSGKNTAGKGSNSS